MPWVIIEVIDEETAEETTHILPFVEVENSFATEEEALAFAEEVQHHAVTDENDTVIGIHKGHTLSANCVCGPKVSERDEYLYIHNAAN